jgi:hypothetical protein
MGRKGDLLELIDEAPRGIASLSGSVWRWINNGRAREASERLTRASNVLVSIRTMEEQFGEGTHDEHLRIVCDLPDRWRVEYGTRLEIRDGDTRWVGTAHRMHEQTHDRARLDDSNFGFLVRPGPYFFGLFDLGDVTEDEVIGRPCLKVEARTRTTREIMRMMPIVLRLGGIEHGLWFDAETGVLLRHVGLVDDEPCAITEFKDIAFGLPESELESMFRPPGGADVNRHIDALIAVAEAQGIDLAGVDREDPQAVRAAISFHRQRHGTPPPQETMARRRTRFVPMGPPPDDEEGARAAIEYAYSHHDETDVSGQDLVNVQSGKGMAGPLREAKQRIPGGPGVEAKIVVDDIMFLRSDEAVVWFAMEVDGGRMSILDGQAGRALRVGGRWVIERASMVGLLEMAGVTVPAPEQ